MMFLYMFLLALAIALLLFLLKEDKNEWIVNFSSEMYFRIEWISCKAKST